MVGASLILKGIPDVMHPLAIRRLLVSSITAVINKVAQFSLADADLEKEIFITNFLRVYYRVHRWEDITLL